MSGVIGVSTDEIDTDTDLREYGLDSISLTEFAEKVNEYFAASINPTIFFEYPDIKGLSTYLVESGSVAGDQQSVTDTVSQQMTYSQAVKDSGKKEMVIASDLEKELAQILADLLNISYQEIDEKTDLREFGLDSISITEFMEKINNKFATDINATLMFEYSNIKEIADYMLREYSAQISSVLGQPDTGKDVFYARENLCVPEVAQYVDHVWTKGQTTDEIAVIGISGRMPQADNLEEFWKNLVAQKDVISEIPADRWNWEEYFGDPQTVGNKTNSKWGGFLKDVRSFDAVSLTSHLGKRN